MGNPYFREIFEYPIEQFSAHLEMPGNDRIIFSGKFGIGKTKFIEDFFTEKNQKSIFLDHQKYTVYCLSPIHYSISSTEDVINYIKYDVIFEFLRKGYEFESKDLEFIERLPLFLKQNLTKVAAAMIRMIPEVGKDISESIEKIQQLREEFDKFSKEANQSDGDVFAEYLEKLEQKNGSIYGNDVVTKLIANVVTKKGENPILIIDDLDRLDPEHIFRILNVFSAHFHSPAYNQGQNKFGFKKIILVC